MSNKEYLYSKKKKSIDKQYENFKRIWKFLNRIKPIQSNSKLLDVGCGIGNYTSLFKNKGLKTYGIDINFDFINFAKKNRKSYFLVGRSEKLPFKKNKFDICICNSLLEHVRDWESIITEAKRILKPKGILSISTTNTQHPFQGEIKNFPLYPWIPQVFKNKLLNYIIKNKKELINYSDHPAVNWFTYNQLKKYLIELNFKVFDIWDLVSKEDLKNHKKILKPFLWLFKNKCLKYFGFFFLRSTFLFAIKNLK